jgi:septum formation protein
MPPLIDESAGGITDPQRLAEDISVRKVKKIIDLMKGRLPLWICGADTIISVDGEIYGKPRDRDDAQRMLQKLRGREHQVVTGVALYCGRTGAIDCRSVVSSVSFAPFSDSELEWYLNTGEWQGVAGAYKIQGLAACFVSGVRGSPSSIAGLPMHEFYVMLRENGYPYGDTSS